MLKWGKQSPRDRLQEQGGGRRGGRERKRAAPVTRLRRWGRRQVTNRQHTRKRWDTSQCGQGGCSSSRCSRTFTGWGRTRSRGNQNCRDLIRTWRSSRQESPSRQNSSSFCQGAGTVHGMGGTGKQDGHSGGISVLGGTAVLWLRAPGDHCQSHQQWGKPMLGRLDHLGNCSSLQGAMLGGSQGSGLPPKYWDPSLGAREMWLRRKQVLAPTAQELPRKPSGASR